MTIILASCHSMIASFTQMPHWELNGEEEKKLGQAIRLAAKYLDIRSTEKASDYLAIAGLLGEIYIPRGVLTYQTIQERRAPPRPPGVGHNGGPPLDTGPIPAMQPAGAIGLGSLDGGATAPHVLATEPDSQVH